jgi:PPOX class probable F420-dependent enzyme
MSSIAGVLAQGRYMAVSTFRANGEAVVTPVWVADLGDGTVGFTTAANSGKVRRLERNGQVQVAPCTMRGVVHSGVPLWCGTARVVRGDHYRRVRKAIERRYRFQLMAIELWGRIRGKRVDEVGVVLSFPADHDLNGHGAAT